MNFIIILRWRRRAGKVGSAMHLRKPLRVSLSLAPFGAERVFYGKISPAVIEPDELPEFDSPLMTNISQAEVNSVRSDLVRMRQADAEEITAEEVELQQSAAGYVKAILVNARMSAMATVDAQEVSLEGGAVGYVHAEKASVSGYTGVVVAGSAEVHHGTVGYLAARDIHAQEVRTVILLARNVQGNVITTFDTRGALIAGLVSGLFGGLMLLLGRFLLRRS